MKWCAVVVAFLLVLLYQGCEERQAENRLGSAEAKLLGDIMDLKGNQIPMPRIPLFERMFWFNAEPEVVTKLKGKVVLVDFWEYTCVNCVRTLPYIKAWNERYADKGLIILGVHTPEFEFGKKRENVARAVNDFDLRYPIVMDNDYTIWRIFGNRYWPAKYLIDKDGILRYHHFGEGNYEETEYVIQRLLKEVNPNVELPPTMKPIRATDQPGAACYRVTPETYLGFERGHIGNKEGYREKEVVEYRDPGKYKEDTYYLVGRWWNGPENVRLSSLQDESGSIIINYIAAELNLVIHPEQERDFKVYVEQDGRQLTDENKGVDIKIQPDGRTYLLIDQPRMYSLVKNRKFGRYILKVSSNSNGFGAYAFTFVSSCEATPAQ